MTYEKERDAAVKSNLQQALEDFKKDQENETAE